MCCKNHLSYGKCCGACWDCAKLYNIPIVNDQMEDVGFLQKFHNGGWIECFTMADRYNIDFPSDDIELQALFLAAVEFIDMLYFEFNYLGIGVV